MLEQLSHKDHTLFDAEGKSAEGLRVWRTEKGWRHKHSVVEFQGIEEAAAHRKHIFEKGKK